VRELLKSPDPQIRQQAIRVSETLYKAGDRSFAADWKALTKDADVDVVLQALMTVNTLKVSEGKAVIESARAANTAKGVQLVTGIMLNPPAGRAGGGGGAGGAAFSAAEEAALTRGQAVYTELCFACHGEDGRGAARDGAAVAMAPSLAGSTRVMGHRDHVIKVLLHGLTGPLGGNAYSEVMIPMGQQNDEWIAGVGSYIRNAFGNRASMITPADVARVRAATADRRTSWTAAELEASLPRQVVVDSGWKFSASHNPAIAAYAVSIQPWTSGVAQAPGVWLQVELPQPVSLAEVQFESSALAVDPDPVIPGQPPRSGGGRGGAAGGPAPSVGYPRGYQVQVSMDGTSWGAPVAQGAGSGTFTSIPFAPVRGRFVRISATAAAADTPLTIQRLRLYEVGAR
jgi:mono/diheme cytochrome c family protein